MLSDEEIIRDIHWRRSRAVEILYDRYAPLLLGICLRYCGNREDAEDVLHDSFIKIIRKLHTFRVRDKGSFPGWMRTIAVNTALNFLRDRQKSRNTVSADHLPELPAESGEEEEQELGGRLLDIPREQVMELICHLPEGYRTVFNLYVFEDYSHKEIAGMLSFSENTSKSQLSKARAMLRKQLTGLTMQKTESHEKSSGSAG